MANENKFARVVEEICFEVADILKKKNEAYGDSALNPVRVFSKADPVEQLRVRIDDKLSRIVRGSADGEDVRLDLVGYLILWETYDRLKKLEAEEAEQAALDKKRSTKRL